MDPIFEPRIKFPAEQSAARHEGCQPTRAFVAFSQPDLEGSIPGRFEKIVSLFPDRIAVKDGDRSLTYDQLNRAANRIGRAIQAERGDTGEPIALLFDQTIELIQAIFGVLKAGKFCVVLDPLSPLIRTLSIVEDSQAELILANRRTSDHARQLCDHARNVLMIDEIGSGVSEDNIGATIKPAGLSSIVYTSGTTGTPKGVVDTHGNILESSRLLSDRIDLIAADRLSLLHHLNSASARTNLYLALLNGASLFPFDVRRESTENFVEWLHREKITILYCPVAFLRHLAASRPDGLTAPGLRVLHLSGAPITRSDFALYKRCFPDGVRLEISMGSTEARAIAAAVVDKQFVFPAEGCPVGYPPPGKSISILDDAHRPLPRGEIGEIAVKGKNLNPGYWRQAALTDEKYRPDPDGSEEQIYLTGDLGLMLPDGFVVHLGRKDLMVKIRGYRVNLTEIEAALLEHRHVKEAAVVAWDHKTAEEYLAAYIVARQESPLNVSELNRSLRDRLPEYMIPSAFVSLPELPLANGKLNRYALPKPDRQRPHLSSIYLPPRNDVEKAIAKIWCEVLALDDIGVMDNFFDLGGHSLSASQVISRIIRTFQLKLPIKALFQAPTVAEMAPIVENTHAKQASDRDLAELLRKIEAMTDREVHDRLAGINRE